MRFFECHLHLFLDGLVYKGGGFPNKSSVMMQSVQLLPCPPLAWAQKPRYHLKNNIPRLVFAGKVTNKDVFPQIFGDLYYIPIIRSLTKQGLSVDIFASHSRDKQQYQEQFSDYLQEETDNSQFVIHQGIPIRELVSKLSIHFDFGLILHYLPDDLLVGEAHLDSGLPSKLFTYLAAGLPIIVSEQYVYVASWVLKHKVGIVVRECEIDHLAALLKRVDYKLLCKNVQKVQEQLPLKKNMNDIYNMLFSCTNAK